MDGLQRIAKAYRAAPSDCTVLEQYSQLLERVGLPSAALQAAQQAFLHDGGNPTRAAAVTLAIAALHRRDEAAAHLLGVVVPLVDAQLQGLRARAGSSENSTGALERDRHGAVWPVGVIAARFSEFGWHAEANKCADELARLDAALAAEGHPPSCTALVNCILGDALVKRGGGGRAGEAQSGEVLSAAIVRFQHAVRATPGDVRSRAGLADVLKDQGAFEEALVQYRAATRLSAGADPVHVFNQAQCLEYVGEYATAIAELDAYREAFAEANDPTQRMQHRCVPLLLTKLLFLSGRHADAERVPSLLDETAAYSADQVMELRRAVPTHWAYVHFIRSLFANHTPPPLPPRGIDTCPTLAVVGDSHCLSLAWGNIGLEGVQHVAVPYLVTGLKVWHMRAGLKFLTNKNLSLVLQNLPQGSPVLFTAGEIDCREGLLRAVQAGKYASLQEAVSSTVSVFVNALIALRAEFGHRFYVLPVPPPAKGSSANSTRSAVVALFNAACHAALRSSASDQIPSEEAPDGIYLLNYFDRLSVGPAASPTLHQDFEADGIHLNSSVLPIIEEHLKLCE